MASAQSRTQPRKSSMSDTASRGWLIIMPSRMYSRDDIIEALSGYDLLMSQLEGDESAPPYWYTWVEHNGAIRYSTLKKRLPGCSLTPRKDTKAHTYARVFDDESRLGNVPRIAIGDTSSFSGIKTKPVSPEIAVLRSAILDDKRSFEQVLIRLPEAATHLDYARELIRARDTRLARKKRGVTTEFVFGASAVDVTNYVLDKYPNAYHVWQYETSFDDYRSERVLFLDAFNGQFSPEFLTQLMSGRPVMLPARPHNIPALYDTLVIASTVPPRDVFNDDASRDRFIAGLSIVTNLDAVSDQDAID